MGYESSDHCIKNYITFLRGVYMFYATATIISTISHQRIRLKVGIEIRICYCSKKFKKKPRNRLVSIKVFFHFSKYLNWHFHWADVYFQTQEQTLLAGLQMHCPVKSHRAVRFFPTSAMYSNLIFKRWFIIWSWD